MGFLSQQGGNLPGGCRSMGNPTCSKEGRVPCSSLQQLQRKQGGLDKQDLVGGGLDKGFRTSRQRSGSSSFSFLEIVTRWEKREERTLLHLSDSPRKPFWVQPQGSMVCQQLFCNMRHKKPIFKIEVSRGTEKQLLFFFFFPNFLYHLQSATFHYYHKAMGQITVLGGAFGKLFCSALSPDAVESSYTCHFTLPSGFWSQGYFNV